MKSFLIGRKKDCDIVIADPSVSRQHAELVVSSGAQFVLVDCDSKFGTSVFVKNKKEWQRITTMRVNPDDRIKLGRYETTVKDLAAKIPHGDLPAPPAERELPDIGNARSPVERNPETGEIVTRRRR